MFKDIFVIFVVRFLLISIRCLFGIGCQFSSCFVSFSDAMTIAFSPVASLL